MRLSRLFCSTLVGLFVAGCASSGSGPTGWISLAGPLTIDTAQTNESDPDRNLTQTDRAVSSSGEVQSRTIPTISTGRGIVGSFETRPSELPGNEINVTLPAQPVPAFINTVFGEILQLPFSLGPQVSERSDIISLRSVRDMDPATFLSLVEVALKDYGLAVTYEGGLYRVVEMDALRAQMPQFITSRAQSHVPPQLRPVVQFVELTAIDSADMNSILVQAFPDRNLLNIQVNRLRNSLVLSGLVEDVDAALSIIREMDELRYAGTQVITYSPRNWVASRLATDLSSILTIEGFVLGTSGSNARAITIFPLDFTNQLMIFASDAQLATYVVSMARRLDAEAYQSEASRPHVYHVQNTEASALATIVSSVLQGASSSTGPVDSGAAGGASQNVQFGNITVDEPGNRLIIVGTQDEFEQIQALLVQLDTPQPEVLIEVTIAEVTLTDDMSYGLDAVFSTEAAAGFTASLTSASGFNGVVNTGQITLSASASAGSNQINILSTPRIFVRSGSVGMVQVGTDVPIITSQRAAPTQDGGSTDVLQTVAYRSTGIILNVEPRVYSGNRIDLTISQEVSSAEVNTNTAIASPTISNRSLSSEMSLQDGQTAVLGGLIETRFTRGRNGVPFLRDIPVVGAAFSSESFSASRTMLIVLVTPYILDTQHKRQQIADALIRAMNSGFYNQIDASDTLRAPDQPFQIRARPTNAVSNDSP